MFPPNVWFVWGGVNVESNKKVNCMFYLKKWVLVCFIGNPVGLIKVRTNVGSKQRHFALPLLLKDMNVCHV